MPVPDESVDTERPSLETTVITRVGRKLEDVLDDLANLLQEEIDYRRAHSDRPPPDTRRSG